MSAVLSGTYVATFVWATLLKELNEPLAALITIIPSNWLNERSAGSRRIDDPADRVMNQRPIIPEGEKLRRAIRWISAQDSHGLQTIEAACRRFDLSPADEAFLLKHCQLGSSSNDEG